MLNRVARSLILVGLSAVGLLAACSSDSSSGPGGAGRAGSGGTSNGKGGHGGDKAGGDSAGNGGDSAGNGGDPAGGAAGEPAGGAGGDPSGGAGGMSGANDGGPPGPVVSGCNATDMTGIAHPFGSHKFEYAAGSICRAVTSLRLDDATSAFYQKWKSVYLDTKSCSEGTHVKFWVYGHINAPRRCPRRLGTAWSFCR